MKYIQGTIVLPLILLIDKSVNIKWYVDAEFAVYKDMRIHTGRFMTMGTRGDYVQSRGGVLNTKSSTYSKLSIVGDVLTRATCTWYFMKVQGYKIRDNVIYQYNQSAIKLKIMVGDQVSRVQGTSISGIILSLI